MNPDVIVVGAGIAGLAVALRLQEAGRQVVVYESDNRVGGHIRTDEVDGFLVEAGPQSIRGAGAATARLIRDAGLLSKVVPANLASRKRLLLHKGQLQAVPSSVLGLFQGGPIEPGAAWRALREPLVRRGWRSGETVHDFVCRRFGPGIAEPLVDAMVGGIFAGDPRELEVESAFPTMMQAEHTHGSVIWGMVRRGGRNDEITLTKGPFSFDDGLEMLPRAIAAKLGDNVRLRSEVTAVLPVADGAEVHVAGERLRARHVVVAVPPPAASALVAPWAAIPRPATSAPVAAIHLGWPAGKGPLTDGFGWLAASSERQDCLGVIWVSATFPHLAPGLDVVRVMVGGSRAPQLATLSERALMHHAMDVICKVQGVVPEPSLVHVVRHLPGIPQYTSGHAEYVRQLRALVPGVHPLGWGFTGVGLTHGLQAAESLAQRIIAAE